ncbi:MAG: hypothetical protein WCR21_12150 [Bacteroidota bacterium]
MKKLFIIIIVTVVTYVNKAQTEIHWTLEPLNVPGNTQANLGTSSDDPLNFVTNNITRLVLDTSGNFKITNMASAEGANDRLLFVNSQGQLKAASPQSGCGGTMPWFLNGNVIGSGETSSNTIGTCNAYDFILKANNSNGIWLKSNSKVGIGEASPTAKLEVLEGSALANGSGTSKLLTSIRAIVNNNFQNNLWVIRDQSNSNNSDWTDVLLHDGISIDGSFLTPGTDTRTWWQRQPNLDLQQWGTANTTYMSLNQSTLSIPGFVYIGTQVPKSTGAHIDARLSVDGKILAKSIFVNIHATNWADYVFEKDYHLMGLNELEKYVQKNKHLPNVPSGKDLTGKDDFNLDISQMQKIQMEKIEELYLYVIQQQKEIDLLKQENEGLKLLIKK